MNHLSEEELILHYYGEEADAFAAEHTSTSARTAGRIYASLQRVLNVVDTLPVPARGEEYGARSLAAHRRPAARAPLVEAGRLLARGPA